MVFQILQCSLNSVVAPRGILSGEAKNGIDDFLTDAWATGLSLVAEVERPRDSF
jgi:hypothetical protein